MKGEVDILLNFPIDTSLKTIGHSALGEKTPEEKQDLYCTFSNDLAT